MTWRERAACLGKPTGMFFPGYGSQGIVDSDAARRCCASCPVQRACLDYALGFPMMMGIWAGTDATDRVRLRRRRKKLAA